MRAAQLQQPAPAAPGAPTAATLQPNPGQQEGQSASTTTEPLAQLAEGPAAGPSGSGPLKNRAAESTSPYVLAHADSPVVWQLLDDQAIARAKKENKLIFLNVGFRACHYCRLTTQDSFSNPTVATLLNTAFIPVIVDREERPDIDAIYMNYIQAVNGDGGWPINVFLTPELEPVFGGTYWPGPGTEHSRSAGGGGGSATAGGVSRDEEPGDNGDDDSGLDFLVILRKVQKFWAEQEARCRKEAKDILLQLRDFAAEGTLGTRGIPATAGTAGSGGGDVVHSGSTSAGPTPAAGEDLDLDLDQLEEAYTHIEGTFDGTNGGFGLPPKFPTPAKLSFLLRLARFPPAVRYVVGDAEVARATDMALRTLRRIRDGGLRDHVGAGFARYSVTADWAMPHFEKMVADNVLLLGVYLDAWLSGVAKDSRPKASDEFADVVFELAEYLTSPPIRLEAGGLATSEVADSFYRKGDRHAREGAYYLWTRREFDAVVGSGSDGQHASTVAAAYWNVLEHGNVPRDLDPHDEFLNQNVLCVVKDTAELSPQFGMPVEEARRLLAAARTRLRDHRAKERAAPEVDAKVVAAVNGMAIGALARTGSVVKYVNAEKGRKYVDAARTVTRFLREKMWDGESKILYRMYHGTRGQTKGFAEDYAFVIEGLLELYEATAEEEWLQWADELQKTQLDLFYDQPATSKPTTPGITNRPSSCGAFYSTASSASDQHAILRLKDGMDTVQPSANAVSASNLFRLAALLADKAYAALARETINAFEVEMLQYPWLFVGLLTGVVSARLGGPNVLVVGGGEEGKVSAADAVLKRFRTAPRAALRAVVFYTPGREGEKKWLEGRNAALGKFAREAKAEAGAVYALVDGEYRPATDADLEGEEGER